jgi:esterase/lipase superfamily enzyme
MHRRHELLESPAMGRRMHVWVYGHWGPPVVVFPSAAGFAHEWEAQGMLEAIGDLVGGGRIKLYCPESNVGQTWTDKQSHPAERMQRHRLYERFVVEELVPAIRRDCNSPTLRMATSGCSLGGFYAANFALKFPEIFGYALCMSGRYEMTHFTGGFTNGDVYFNNPLAYVPNLSGEPLERVRRNTHLTLVCGQGMWEEGCIEETQALADVLEAKGIPHERDIWGKDVAHQWPWWRRQARYHLGRVVG